MDAHHLKKQLDQDIKDAEKHLAFWSEQARLQTHTIFAGTVANIAENADQILQHLRSAREVFEKPSGD